MSGFDVASTQRSPGSGQRLVVMHLITGLGSGGAEQMLMRLVTSTHATTLRHVVVSMTDEGMHGPSIRAAGISLITLGMRRGRPKPSAWLRLLGLLRREAPDVLQTWLYHADLMGVTAARLAGVKCLAWNLRCSDMDMSNYSRTSAMLPHVLARLSWLPRAAIVNAAQVQRYHEHLGYRIRRWQLIPNGLDLTVFTPNLQLRLLHRGKLGVAGDAPLIGLVARYDPMKDHANFIQAAKEVSAVREDAVFVLVGKDVVASNSDLVKQIENVGLVSRFRLLGEHDDIAALMPALDLLVLSSAFGEGFPNVLAEAMACAVPCVTTDVGGAADIVGDCGRVVPPRNAIALADAMRQMLSLTSGARAKLGARARRRIEGSYGLEQIVRRYEDLYWELTGTAREGRDS